KVARFQDGADPTHRVVKLVVAVTKHARPPGCRLSQPEQESQGRRLASAVRTEEAGDGAGLEREREVLDGDELAVALGQQGDRDHRVASAVVGRDGYLPFVDELRHVLVCLVDTGADR